MKAVLLALVASLRAGFRARAPSSLRCSPCATSSPSTSGATREPTPRSSIASSGPGFPPWEAAPRYLIRDRDCVYGMEFKKRVECMGIEEVLTAPRSPWQNPFVERVIGSIRRECLDHVVVFNERHLRRLLGDYFAHCHRWRCHRSLAMDCPAPRPVQGPEVGPVVQVAEAGGLYRHYERRAA